MEQFRLEIIKNATANGRLFCALLVAINLVIGAPVTAVLAALPIGLAFVSDHLLLRGKSNAVTCVSVPLHALAVFIVFATIFNAW